MLIIRSFNQKKTSVGKVGEYLVLDLLKEQYEGADVEIEHVAETEGDGYGYDIRLTLQDKIEVYIEVKTTTFNSVDGFYLTPCELNAARQCLNEETSKTKSYSIYRVYNFDQKTRQLVSKILIILMLRILD